MYSQFMMHGQKHIKNDGYFTWRPPYIFDDISPHSS